MASTVTITCPECDKRLQAPTEVLGKKIRCKGCGATFSARAAGGPDAPAKEPASKAAKPAAKTAKPEEAEEESGAYGVTEEFLGSRCPYCANAMESDDAVICLNCGYNTITRQFARTRKLVHQTGLDIFLWLLPGIACALAAIGLTTFDVLYCLYIEEWVSVDTWYGTLLSWKGTKIWMCVLSVYFVYIAGRFGFIRLVINNMPPEIEQKD